MTIEPFHQICNNYCKQVLSIHSQINATPELSYRTDLDNLLRKAAELNGMGAIPLLEGKKLLIERPHPETGKPEQISVGRPDFIFTNQQSSAPLGYLEAEGFGVNLNKLTGHAKHQNDIFKDCLDNFIITNHIEFQLYVNRVKQDSVNLFDFPQETTVKLDKATALFKLFENFFKRQSYDAFTTQIHSPHDLAELLARRTRQMRNELLNSLLSKNPQLSDLYNSFKTALLPDLKPEEFADIYAQTITYGLFTARSALVGGQKFTRHSATALISESNPFLFALFEHIAGDKLDPNLVWIADDIANLLCGDYMETVLMAFGKRKHQEDIVVHFYETFLAKYDKEKRKARGVYYTPESVVSYIVKSVDQVLKQHFDKKLGLADKETLILDPATGTGSFLFNVINHIYDTVKENPKELGKWQHYVENTQLLQRLFGFEILLAPYVVAHLKLTMLLNEKGFLASTSKQQRFEIYLTNALEEPTNKKSSLIPNFISQEADQAADIKNEKPILVILGNPPYSNYGMMNKNKWILNLLDTYKIRDKVKLSSEEKKLNLNDDFIKFIRFGQWRIDKTGSGILAFICNNTFIDGLTHRFMRQSLLESFDEIYILDLHGSSKKKETCPDGSKDENVFDIQQGVCIVIFIKKPPSLFEEQSQATVFHAEMFGLRETKYQELDANDISTTHWTTLKPLAPDFFFVPKTIIEENDPYQHFWGLKDVFTISGSGVKTERDKLSIHLTREGLENVVDDFRKLNESQLRIKYDLEKDSRDWKVLNAKKDVLENLEERCFQKILYRPFDYRHIWYSGKTRGFIGTPAYPTMQHLLNQENLVLIAKRQCKLDPFSYMFCSNSIIESCIFESAYANAIAFPLYLYQTDNLKGETLKIPNFKKEFLEAFAKALNLKQVEPFNLPENISAEMILHYMYAVFHAPSYREKYAERLKTDFPRLPLPQNIQQFQSLIKIGEQLIGLHLLDNIAIEDEQQRPLFPFAKTIPELVENMTIQKPDYIENQQRIYVNKTHYFGKVEKGLWEFRIGGYQVCEKWLKDRKDRILTAEEITHYQRILVALSKTQQLMKEIDTYLDRNP